MRGTDPYDAPDDEYLCASSIRKPKIVNSEPANADDDEELSDYVKIRLLIARTRAMQQYKEVWG